MQYTCPNFDATRHDIENYYLRYKNNSNNLHFRKYSNNIHLNRNIYSVLLKSKYIQIYESQFDLEKRNLAKFMDSHMMKIPQ